MQESGWAGRACHGRWSSHIRPPCLTQAIVQRGYAQLTILRLSDNLQALHRSHSLAGRSNQYCTKPISSFPPSALLYTNTPGEFKSPGSLPTRYRIHNHRSIGAEHWARKSRQGLNAGIPVKSAATP